MSESRFTGEMFHTSTYTTPGLTCANCGSAGYHRCWSTNQDQRSCMPATEERTSE